jgi:hypothetical protein
MNGPDLRAFGFVIFRGPSILTGTSGETVVNLGEQRQRAACSIFDITPQMKGYKNVKSRNKKIPTYQGNHR